MAICELSDDLSALTGIRYLRRCDVMKFMWAYFRLHNLFDPKDRRLVVLNEPLKKVFGNSPKKIRVRKLILSSLVLKLERVLSAKFNSNSFLLFALLRHKTSFIYFTLPQFCVQLSFKFNFCCNFFFVNFFGLVIGVWNNEHVV